jgi:uncharacterized membrane protein YphA (DoxX/SURF4 family)
VGDEFFICIISGEFYNSVMLIITILILASLFIPSGIASAHEAYVLPYNTFWGGMGEPLSFHALDAMKSPANIHLTILIVVSVFLCLGFNFLLRLTKIGEKIHRFPERFSSWGPHAVRISVAIALFLSAYNGVFLGPELHGDLFPYSYILKIILFAISIMIAVGFLTELAALLGMVIYAVSFIVYGPYMLSYLNYFGEFVVLFLFGMRAFSLDTYIFGPLDRFKNFEKYETVIVRVLYGLALVYAAVTVKLLHPEVTLDVINTWNLTQFHWLFPSDPLLVTFGAGIVESVIGIFIIFGFEMRLTILISLFYITLSLFYFREMVWPHLLLYGISFNLLVQPEVFTLDHFFFESHRTEKSWWRRPFSAYIATHKGNK